LKLIYFSSDSTPAEGACGGREKWAGGMGEVVAMETGEAGALKTGGSECSELPCVKGGQWVKAEVTGELLAISQ